MAKVLAASLSFCKYSIHQTAGEILRAAGIEVDTNDLGRSLSETELLSVIENYEGVIAGTDPITAEVIRKGKNLKIIAKNGIGYDNIDVKAATEQRVYVTITPGTVEKTVADSTFALMLALARNITLGNSIIRKGEWPRIVGIDIWNKKLGIIGLGRIGKNVVLRAKGFNMDVYAYDPFPDTQFCEQHGVHLVAFEELFKTCDFISLHAPLMESTTHIVNERTLSLMKPEAYLINTSRGGLVDEAALYQVLKQKKIAGAAIDVFSKEPPGEDFPLFELENVILTPHLAGYSRDGVVSMGIMVAESILSALRGEIPQHALNKDWILPKSS